MAITTTYSASFVSASPSTVSVSQASGTQRGPAVVALDNGNSAIFYYDLATNEIAARTVSADNTVLGPRVLASTSSIYVPPAGSGNYEPVSAARLNNGNIVLTWVSNEATKNVYYRIFDSNLNPLTAGALAETSTANAKTADVAALAGGGFVIVWEKAYDAGDSDPSFRRFDLNGAGIDTANGTALDGSFTTVDAAPSVAGLVDGGFAVAWHRVEAGTGETSAYHAVRNGDGTVRLGPTMFDTIGTVNHDMDVVARLNGGYTILYEDSGWLSATETELTAWNFTAAGASQNLGQASFSSLNDSDVSAALSVDGYIATIQTAGNGLNMNMSLLGQTGAVLFTDVIFASAPNVEIVGGIDWISGSRVRVAYERQAGTGGTGDTDNGVDTRVFEVTRTVTGDTADNTINFQFESLNNTMYGGDGNDVLIGGLGADLLIGQNNNDVLIGNAGNDTLIGGAGANEFYGGAGDDLYEISSNLDSVIELADGGTDRIRINLNSYTLPSNVENLTANGSTSFLGIGNALDNVIMGLNGVRDELFGRDGNDTLNDSGGAPGAEDTLIGGIGDDIYLVGARGSSTIELVGQGTDEVRTGFSIYALQANVENLTALFTGTNQALVGNVLGNTIRGNVGVDDLFGREGNDSLHGGTGAANTLLGQEGDDTYNVEAVGDSVIEFAAQGTDTVVTTVANFTLPANVENLTFVSAIAHIGVGNTLANTLTGGGAADFLNAGDGADVLAGLSGADELTGGAGADQFRYAGTETGVDRIYDFLPGTDKIALLTSGYTPTATRGFVQGPAPVALDPVSTFLYNTATGMVSYDDDGTGAGAAVAFTQLNAGLNLSLGDFIFF